jgi:hypothetical protein
VPTQILDQRGISSEVCPPIVALLAITGISQTLTLGESVGLTAGHEEAIAFIERFLDRHGPPREPTPPRTRPVTPPTSATPISDAALPVPEHNECPFAGLPSSR